MAFTVDDILLAYLDEFHTEEFTIPRANEIIAIIKAATVNEKKQLLRDGYLARRRAKRQALISDYIDPTIKAQEEIDDIDGF